MASKNVNIGFDEEFLKEIDNKAKDEGRSRSSYIRFIIGEYFKFEEKERQYNNKIANLEKEVIEKNVIIKAMPDKQVKNQTDTEEYLEPMNFKIGGLK